MKEFMKLITAMSNFSASNHGVPPQNIWQDKSMLGEKMGHRTREELLEEEAHRRTLEEEKESFDYQQNQLRRTTTLQ